MGNLKSKFDDVVQDGDGHEWSQICKDCVGKLKVSKSSLNANGSGICGVEGCSNESDHYIDLD